MRRRADMENVITVEKSKRNKKIKKTAMDVLAYVILSLLVVLFLFPLFVMVSMSLLPDSEINTQVILSPTGTINLGTYISILMPPACP